MWDCKHAAIGVGLGNELVDFVHRRKYTVLRMYTYLRIKPLRGVLCTKCIILIQFNLDKIKVPT